MGLCWHRLAGGWQLSWGFRDRCGAVFAPTRAECLDVLVYRLSAVQLD